MPWTESRSREEWLAEVRRRGERIRRRRQFTLAVVAAFALVLPMSAVAGYLVGPPDYAVELSVAGPAPEPAGDVRTAPTTPEVDALVTPNVPTAVDQASPPSGASSFMTTTTEVHRGVASIVDPVVEPTVPPRTGAPADNPVVSRSNSGPEPSPLARNSANGAGTAALSSSVATASPGPLAPCTATDVSLTITLEKYSYGPGETVKGSATMEKVSAGTCLLPDWGVGLSILNASLKDVSQGSQRWATGNVSPQASNWTDACGTAGCRRPVEPGSIFIHTFEWESRDCMSPRGPIVPVPDDRPCPPFPAGSYKVVAEWTGPQAGPSARQTFDLAG